MLTKWKKKKESLSSRFLFRIARRSFDLSVPSWRRNVSRGRDPQITPRITPPSFVTKNRTIEAFFSFFFARYEPLGDPPVGGHGPPIGEPLRSTSEEQEEQEQEEQK